MSPAELAIDLSLIATIGGALSLDRRASFQLMLSQPMIAVSILGLVFGDIQTGVIVGSTLQLLWMSCVLFGSNIPRNDTLASVTIGGYIFLFAQYVSDTSLSLEPSIWALAIIIGAPACILGQWLDVRLDHLNKTLATSADDAVSQGRFHQVGVNVARAIFRTFIVHAAATAVTTSLTFLLLMQIMLQTGDSLTESLMVIGTYIVPALGVAVAMIMVRPRAGMAIASVTFAIVVASIMQGLST